MIEKVCVDHGVDCGLLEDLCDIQVEYSGSGRPEGINARISHALEEFLEREDSAAEPAARAGVTAA